jgi:hypothetical protein
MAPMAIAQPKKARKWASRTKQEQRDRALRGSKVAPVWVKSCAGCGGEHWLGKCKVDPWR